jgi:hypothetical protein
VFDHHGGQIVAELTEALPLDRGETKPRSLLKGVLLLQSIDPDIDFRI